MAYNKTMELSELTNDGIFRESLVTKGVVSKIEDTKILEIARDKNVQTIGRGVSEGEVRNGLLVKTGRKILKFAEKVFNSAYFNDEKISDEITLERIVKNQARLKKMGFPVINTMRIIDVPDGHFKRMMMTDLTEGGKKLVVSSMTGDSKIEGFDLANFEEVQDELLVLYKNLNEKGVIVPHHDVFFLVVDKITKNGSIVLGDVSRVLFAEDEEEVMDKTIIEATNYESTKGFVDRINNRLYGASIPFGKIREFMMNHGTIQ